jgi:ribosomal protein S18 acetylase RimI-like enzyme
MENDYYAQCVAKGVELYFRTLGHADNMHLHTGDIEWIAPLPNTPGPSIVYKISLDERTAAARIDELIPLIKSKHIPSAWYVSATSTPANIVEILLSRGFVKTLRKPTDPDEPEAAMALDMAPDMRWAASPSFEIRRVTSFPDFERWIDVVNEALHGCELLLAKYNYPLVARASVSFYLALLDGIPIATAATMQEGDIATLEFVSTLKAHRRKGAGSAACSEALRDLQKTNVRTVTLRASHEAIPLYAKLGFRPYFEPAILFYVS